MILVVSLAAMPITATLSCVSAASELRAALQQRAAGLGVKRLVQRAVCISLTDVAFGIFWVVPTTRIRLRTGEIRSYGVAILAPNPMLHLLLALAVISAVARVAGTLFRRLGQAPVIGEIVGGICLWPLLLGGIAPKAWQSRRTPA